MRVTSSASFSRPADNTAYQAGDAIANSGTAASVVPLVFDLPFTAGYVTGCRCVVTPASSNLVIANFAFDLLLFRPEKDTPYAAGSFIADNSAMTITAASYRHCVSRIPFASTGWYSGAGSASVAGATGRQEVAVANRGFSVPGKPYQLIGVVQAQAAWTPTGIANQFDFVLDMVSA